MIYPAFVLAIISFSLIHGSLFSSYKIIYRGGGAQHTPGVITNVVSEDQLKNIDYWYISTGEANSFKYHLLYGGLKNKLSNDSHIIIEKLVRRGNQNEIVNQQLSRIYDEAEPGSEIIIFTGHAGDREPIYFNNILKYFNGSVRIGEFFQSSGNGEFSLGGEQAFYAMR